MTPTSRAPMFDGLRLAVTTFTIAPINGPQRIDRDTAGAAMRWAPVIGALLGAVLTGILYGLGSSLLPAVLVVTAAAVLTRGMHLDGLADTVDALGSYRSRERALEIMKSPEVGPFGVVAIVLVLLLQTVAIAGMHPLALIPAYAAGRLAATIGCQTGVPSARRGGLGALVAGTVSPLSLAVLTIAVAASATVPGHLWQGPLAVIVALGIAVMLRRHAVKRFGGITGDVLGFLIEVTTTITLVLLHFS